MYGVAGELAGKWAAGVKGLLGRGARGRLVI